MEFSLSGIGYAALGLLLISLSPLFARSGAKRLAPALGALSFSVALLPCGLFILLYRGTGFDLTAGALLPALGASLSLSACLLFFFRAIAGGQVLHALPLVRICFLPAAILSLFSFDQGFDIFSIIYLLLFLLGLLLMISGQGRYRDRGFLLYATASGLLLFAFDRCAMHLSSGSLLLSLMLSAGLLLIVCILGGTFSGAARIRFEQLLFSLAAGGAAGSGAFALIIAGNLGFSPLSSAIAILSLPLTLLLSRIFLKERASGLYGLGLLLLLGGLAAFLFQSI